MPVDTLSCFPCDFVAGDTVIVALADSDYPSDDWTLAVVLRNLDLGTLKSFTATPNDNDAGFSLTIDAADSALLLPGLYSVTYVYTETDSGQRYTSREMDLVLVQPDPSKGTGKSVVRLTLDAMQTALQKLASGTNLSFSANGQSFTKKNLDELQKAIEKQRDVVRREESAAGILNPNRRYSGIGTRFA